MTCAPKCCAKEQRTLIFYEAPHKLIATLEDMLRFFGDRKISICRELTKVHEQVIRTTLGEAVGIYGEDNPPRGEYVLIVEGCRVQEHELSNDEALERARELVRGGMRLTDACKEAAKSSGLSKSEIYSALAGEKGDD